MKPFRIPITNNGPRGLRIGEFRDANNGACSIQESSAASEPMIWLGRSYSDRMHLTREMAAALLPHLTRFAERGTL
jgi:hypothetical protein